MADTNYPLTADDGLDDLPRTLRRERDAREREARERAQAEDAARRPVDPIGEPARHMPRDGGGFGPDVHPASVTVHPDYEADLGAPIPAEVTRLNIPFLHLVGFFLKAVLAAVPAIILLGGLLWGIGHLLQTYFPWLVKMQIFIHFPS